ncbi:CobW family GTP-binding protein [Kushneria indalinina]|uniref:G3E family GTPase n=1 Tax=Kushneria indalinina DSM 14324 TaxID=1122140 RepID=A0A3D9DVQ9_9GAMM|nr:CobW family GTP-binding protein [Kushneria indalinina]REC94761.1 G3E family GTPase [Kushneria indalinina DSM 14324]
MPETTEPATASSPATIPVTLVAGYLGAGKTTWLNRHLRAGVTPGTLVLVNDFGAINVDAELIDYRGDRLLSLDNGCLCCSLSDALGAQLSRIARWPEPPTALIIETSGVALPGRIADMVRVARQYHLASIVTLVDLGALPRHRRDDRIADLVEIQIAAADRLSFNREDRLGPDELASARTWLASINPHATHEPRASDSQTAEPGDTDIETVDAGEAEPRAPRFLARRTGLLDAPNWQRFTCQLPAMAERDALETLLARHAGAVARAKGFLQVDNRHFIFHWSGGRASWTPTAPRAGAGQLVGIGFAGTELDALLDALAELSTSPRDERSPRDH